MNNASDNPSLISIIKLDRIKLVGLLMDINPLISISKLTILFLDILIMNITRSKIRVQTGLGIDNFRDMSNSDNTGLPGPKSATESPYFSASNLGCFITCCGNPA